MTGSSRLPSPEMTAGMMKKKVMSIACTVHMVMVAAVARTCIMVAA